MEIVLGLLYLLQLIVLLATAFFHLGEGTIIYNLIAAALAIGSLFIIGELMDHHQPQRQTRAWLLIANLMMPAALYIYWHSIVIGR